jgi:hypothetical protein
LIAIGWTTSSDRTLGRAPIEEEGPDDPLWSRVAESEDSIVLRLGLDAAIGMVGSSSMTEEDGEDDSDEWVRSIIAGREAQSSELSL